MADFCPWADEWAEVYRVAMRRSRTHRRCCECNGPIAPGDLYRYTFMICVGAPSSWHTCEPCVVGPVAWVEKHCGYYLVAGLFDHLYDVFREHPELRPAVRIKVGRWLIEKRRRAQAGRAVVHG